MLTEQFRNFRRFFLLILGKRIFSKFFLRHLDFIAEVASSGGAGQVTWSCYTEELTLSRPMLNFVDKPRGNDYSEFCLIIQGPIRDAMFTNKSIEIYLNRFPGCQVVVSTWLGMANKIPKDLQRHIIVVESVAPAYPGVGNVNLQIYSTQRGLQSVGDYKYALKIRSDMRINSENALSLLANALRNFGNTHSQINRTIILSLGTKLIRLFSPSDFLQFGYKVDLEQYWDIPLQEMRTYEWAIGEGETPGVSRPYWSQKGTPFAEEYIFLNNVLKQYRHPGFSLEASLNNLRRFFIVFDQSRLELVWPKKTRRDVTNWSKFANPSLDLRDITEWEWNMLNEKPKSFVEGVRNYMKEFN